MLSQMRVGGLIEAALHENPRLHVAAAPPHTSRPRPSRKAVTAATLSAGLGNARWPLWRLLAFVLV